MTYAVAFYKDNKYEGRVTTARTQITSWQEALQIAERWRKAHEYKHQYRAVEFNSDGYLVRSEFDHNDSL